MNERVQELAKEASKWYLANATEFSSPAEWNEKFTELIVRECCEVINAAKPGVVQVPAEVVLDMTAKNVKAYFGIK